MQLDMWLMEEEAEWKRGTSHLFYKTAFPTHVALKPTPVLPGLEGTWWPHENGA